LQYEENAGYIPGSARGEYFPDAEPGRMMSLNFNDSGKKPLGFAMARGWQFYDERPTDPKAHSFSFKTFNGLAQIIIKSADGDFTYNVIRK
jgi:hypothetical protein